LNRLESGSFTGLADWRAQQRSAAQRRTGLPLTASQLSNNLDKINADIENLKPKLKYSQNGRADLLTFFNFYVKIIK